MEWRRIPILAGPLLKANCAILGHPPPHCPPSRQCSITIHTDDINMLDSSSVGYNNEIIILIIISFITCLNYLTIFNKQVSALHPLPAWTLVISFFIHIHKHILLQQLGIAKL